jgi:hypothetical protein
MTSTSQPNLALPITEKLKKEHSSDNLKLRKNIAPPAAPVPLIKNDIFHRSFALYILFHFNTLFFLIYIVSQTLTVYFKVIHDCIDSISTFILI